MLARIQRATLREGQLPGAPVPARPKPAVVTLSAGDLGQRGAGWTLLGHLRGDKNLPQWRARNTVVGMAVGGETGVRSVYLRFDTINVGDMQFIMILEPRRIAPLSGWRSA